MPIEVSIAGALAYLAMTLVFGLLTLHEGTAKRLAWGPHRVAGLILCLAWPLLVIGVLLTVLARDRSIGRNDATMFLIVSSSIPDDDCLEDCRLPL